ncbi:hypothetical protein [Arthrobacter sp. Leaf337]|nr:hypothetical protein [Arthrobacter sp. Leaf337]
MKNYLPVVHRVIAGVSLRSGVSSGISLQLTGDDLSVSRDRRRP